MLRPGGAATVIGMIPVGTKIELHGVDFLRERRIQGSMMGSNRFRTDMPRLIEFYQQGRLHLDELVSGRLALEQINDRLRRAEDRRPGAQRDRIAGEQFGTRQVGTQRHATPPLGTARR
jgi:Zn-dependent alcohol dehydrogenase